MRILMVAPQPFFQPRGTPFSVLHRIRGLRRLGHDVDLVTYPIGETPELPGVSIHRSARPPLVRDVAIGPSVTKLLLDVPLFADAARRAARGGYDLIHTHEEAGLLGAWLRGRTGVPHLYDMHSSLPQQFANFGRYNWGPVVGLFQRMERYTLARADGVIAICPALEVTVREHGYRGPLAMIENVMGFDAAPPEPAETERLRSTLGIANGPALVYTGTFEAYQGLDLLVEAAPLLAGRDEPVTFVLVGGRREQADALRQRARERGVEDMFRFVPPVPPEDVPRYLALADVLVTTRVKGTNTPLKIYEYLRAGRPVVATDIHSHTQALDASSAELVAPTPTAVAEGIRQVLDDEARARDLAEGARRLSRERFSEESYMERLADLLEALPNGRPTSRPLLA